MNDANQELKIMFIENKKVSDLHGTPSILAARLREQSKKCFDGSNFHSTLKFGGIFFVLCTHAAKMDGVPFSTLDSHKWYLRNLTTNQHKLSRNCFTIDDYFTVRYYIF